jgi:hypothetical protein
MMKKVMKWVKGNWTDPVWSKVFAGIILAASSSIGIFIVSIIQKIPVKDLYTKSINNYVQINYFSLILAIFIFLSLLIPAILLNIVKFQLKSIKFPSKLKTNKFDLQNFLNGQWTLTYENDKINYKGGEPVKLINGNQYFIKDRLVFVMTDIEFDETKQCLKWSKITYPGNQRHSIEELRIENNTMIGKDNLGYSLRYIKEQ